MFNINRKQHYILLWMMFFGHDVLCTSLFAKVNSQGTPADSCTKQENSCACKTASGWINLEPLDQAKINGQPK